MKFKGISDQGLNRIAKVVKAQGSDYSEVEELRRGISDAGLYYDYSVAESTLADNFEDPENWVVIETPGKYGMPLLDKINFEVIQGSMEAVGAESENLPNSEIAFRVSENGELNAAGIELQGILEGLANDPVLDTEAYSDAQMDQALDSIESNGRNLVDEEKAPENWANEVFTYIQNSPADHTLYEDSGDGIYVHEDDIKEALQELGWLMAEEEEY